MTRCFIYTRQSSGAAEIDESLSITTQLEECRKFALAKGFEIVGEFADPNSSGRLYPEGFEAIANADLTYQQFVSETGKKNFRKGLGQLLMRLDEVDCIIAYDTTRIHRSLNGSFLSNAITQTLVAHHTVIWTIKEGEVNLANFSNFLVQNITAQVNSEQLMIQRAKSRTAMKKLKESGDWNTQCFKSFGYCSTGRKREVGIVPHRAEAVKLIFKMFLEGKKYFTIARAIAPLLKDDEKAKQLYKTQMMRILKNPIYCGYYPKDDGTLVKASVMKDKELISFADWKKVQEMLKGRKTVTTGARKNFLPLSGKFECGYCGSKINAITTNKTNIHMRCMAYSFQDRPSCKNGVTWKTIEAGGVGLLDALYPLAMVYLLKRISTNDAATEVGFENIQTQIDNVDRKISQLQSMWLEDSIASDAFKSSMKTLNDKRKDLAKQLEQLRQTAQLESSAVGELQVMLQKCFSHKMSEGECELALRSTIEKVVIFRDKVDIILTTGDKFALPVERIDKSKELPMPWIDIKEKGGKPHYTICYSYKRMSPTLKKQMKMICSLQDIRLDICLG